MSVELFRGARTCCRAQEPDRLDFSFRRAAPHISFTTPKSEPGKRIVGQIRALCALVPADARTMSHQTCRQVWPRTALNNPPRWTRILCLGGRGQTYHLLQHESRPHCGSSRPPETGEPETPEVGWRSNEEFWPQEEHMFEVYVCDFPDFGECPGVHKFPSWGTGVLGCAVAISVWSRHAGRAKIRQTPINETLFSNDLGHGYPC